MTTKHFSRLLSAILGLSFTLFASCNSGTATSTTADSDTGTVQELRPAVNLTGNTLTYGDHVYTVDGEIDFNAKNHKKATASVTFSNVPSDYAEFETVYTQLLGKTPQGAAAMIPMAIEMFARDNAVGQKCLGLLCNGSATVDDMVRILKTKLVASQYSSPNDSYIQRYMAAALLKGADNKNAYTADEPYTVEMCSSPNGTKDAPLTGGTVYYLYILANGWDTFQRAVDVLQPYNSEYYKIFNCSSTYTQCKTIVGDWQGLK
jgi:D-methionine transport system substrate-binding protein